MEHLGLDISVETAVDVILREKAIKCASRQLLAATSDERIMGLLKCIGL